MSNFTIPCETSFIFSKTTHWNLSSIDENPSLLASAWTWESVVSFGATRLDLCPTLLLFVRLSLVKLGGHLFSIVLKSSSPATQGLCRKYHQFSFKTLNFQLGLKMALSCPVISSTKTLFPNLLYFHISEKKKKRKKKSSQNFHWIGNPYVGVLFGFICSRNQS